MVLMIKYYDNFMKYDFFDKYFILNKTSDLKNKLSILISLHLRFLKKENDSRILDTLMFLEVLAGSKFFIKKFSFFFSKSFRSKYSELFICCFLRKSDVFMFLKFLNFYFLSFYKKYILREAKFSYNNGVGLLPISKLNRLYKFNKNFKKHDICNISFLNIPCFNYNLLNMSKLSFFLNNK